MRPHHAQARRQALTIDELPPDAGGAAPGIEYLDKEEAPTGTASGAKARVRKLAFAARRAAHGTGLDARGCAHLERLLERLPEGCVVAGYMPIRTEISPLPVMAALAARGVPVCVPVIRGAGRALVFSRWSPGCAMVDGPFGAAVPRNEDLLVPDILITPLLAFDAQGHRLGYGGGFYDRTFAALRQGGGAIGIGFAYDAQERDDLPVEPTDQPLDAVVTETGTRRFRDLPF